MLKGIFLLTEGLQQEHFSSSNQFSLSQKITGSAVLCVTQKTLYNFSNLKTETEPLFITFVAEKTLYHSSNLKTETEPLFITFIAKNISKFKQ